MSIQRLFNNENKVIANKSVIDHNELANRDQYGCHTIQAIRKLPEKLTELKDKDLELTEKIDATSGELANQLEAINANTNAIQEVKENAQKIDIVENQEDGTFTFTNYNNESKTIQSGYQPDEDTLTLTEDDKLALKRVYVDTEFIGTGVKDDALRLNLGSTITKDSLGTLNSAGLYINDDTVLTAEQVNNKLISLETKGIETDSEIEKIKSENTDQNNKIYNLETVTKGMGGYLNSYNFEKATPTQDELTNYALQEIGITDRTKIFNGTKVINEFDKNLWRLDNTPNTDPAVFTWENLGQVQETSIATLDLLGLVKGSTEKLKGAVDLTGEISINNLEEELANKASLIEENTFNGKNNFNAETNFNSAVTVQNIEQNGNPVYGILSGEADPTNATVGGVSQFYLNTTDKKLWQCVATTTDESTSTTSYEWQPVGAGVSQEDFDKLVNNEVQIQKSGGGFIAGGLADAGSGSVAIGFQAKATFYAGQVAIGSYTSAYAVGSVAIGNGAKTTKNWAIQLGNGTNNTANSLQIADDNIYKFDTHTLTVQNIELNGVDLGTQLGDLNTALETILGV